MRESVRKIKCACCGKETEETVIHSNHVQILGLDLRPQNERQLSKIQECSHCHYCSQYIEESIEQNVKRKVNSLNYQRIMNECEINIVDVIGRRFRAAASLVTEYEEKVKLYLEASWYYQFHEKNDMAFGMKRKAVSYIEKLVQVNKVHICLWENTEDFWEKDGLQEKICFELQIIYIDCLRQIGRYGECKDVIQRIEYYVNEKFSSEDVIYKIIQFEKKLIENRDREPHMVSEV